LTCFSDGEVLATVYDVLANFGVNTAGGAYPPICRFLKKVLAMVEALPKLVCIKGELDFITYILYFILTN